MPFRGNLERAAFKVTVDGADTALTVLRITKTDQFNKVETATARAGAPALAEINIGAAAVRVVVSISPPLSGSARYTLDQGTKRVEDLVEVTTDTTFVYDINP